MAALYSFVILSMVFITKCENNLPSYITPCTLTDKDFSDCIKDQIETALPKFTKGIPELNIPPIDPAELNDIDITGSGLNLFFAKPVMHGLSTSKLTDLKVNFGKNEETFMLKFKADLNLTAKYKADGQILILPIKGDGDAIVDARGVEVLITSKLNHAKDSTGEHFKLVSPNYKYTIEKTTFRLENLFNGNKQLSDATHKFANENWQQLMDELAPPAIKQIVKACVKVINKFFSKVTISQIILGYTTEEQSRSSPLNM